MHTLAQAKKQAAAQQQLLQQQEAAARGKKAKLARIKEKYADQVSGSKLQTWFDAEKAYKFVESMFGLGNYSVSFS